MKVTRTSVVEGGMDPPLTHRGSLKVDTHFSRATQTPRSRHSVGVGPPKSGRKARTRGEEEPMSKTWFLSCVLALSVHGLCRA